MLKTGGFDVLIISDKAEGIEKALSEKLRLGIPEGLDKPGKAKVLKRIFA